MACITKKRKLDDNEEEKRVQITLETVSINVKLSDNNIVPQEIRRPVVVEGTVFPTSTGGRGQAPNPIAFLDILPVLKSMQQGTKTYNKNTIFKGLLGQNDFNNYQNRNTFECDKGHIFALFNGGPDISANIIPQLGSGFQQNGEWRKVENNVNKLATELNEEKYRTKFNEKLTLFFQVKLEYTSIKAEKGIDSTNVIDFINMYTVPLQYTYSYFPCVNTITPDNYGYAKNYFYLAHLINAAPDGWKSNDFIPLEVFGGINGIKEQLIPLPKENAAAFFVKENIIKYTAGINEDKGFAFGLNREKEHCI